MRFALPASRLARIAPIVAMAVAGMVPLAAQTAPSSPAGGSAPQAMPGQPQPPAASAPASQLLATQLAESTSLTASLPAPANPAAHTALTGDVMEALTSSPALGLIPITIKVTDKGVVSLNGVVPSEEMVQEAVKAVQAVPGVTKVQSNILVNKDPFAPAAASQPAAPKPQVNPLEFASNNPQAKVERALSANPALSRVSARAYGGVVTIFGSVQSDKAKEQADAIARKTVPNLTVKNIIWVNQHPLAPPPLTPQ